jgi:hypothetical protein
MASDTGAPQEPPERLGESPFAPTPPESPEHPGKSPFSPARKRFNLAKFGFGLSLVPWVIFGLLMVSHPG